MNLLQRILYFPSQNFVHAEKRVNFVWKNSAFRQIIELLWKAAKVSTVVPWSSFMNAFSYVQAIQGILVYRKQVYFKLPSSPVQC